MGVCRSLQFQYFVDLFKFLMKLCRRDFTTDKFDDPNTMYGAAVPRCNQRAVPSARARREGLMCCGRGVLTLRSLWAWTVLPCVTAVSANKIMLELKEMGFEMDFPAIKLKAASGEQVCRVLQYACDHVREGIGVSVVPAVCANGLLGSCRCLRPLEPRLTPGDSPDASPPPALQALQFQNFHFGRPDYHEEE